MSAVQLVSGDPNDHRATFVRFVLPFKWAPEPWKGVRGAQPYFRPAGSHDWLHAANASDSFTRPHLDAQRRRYLAPETESLLFEEASWFVLESGQPSQAPWREFRVRSDIDGTGYGVALRPPSLVLLERGSRPLSELQVDRENLLRAGFLIHEAYFPTEAPTFADFLRFNEIFRYWRCPYPEHAKFCSAELVSIADGIHFASERSSTDDLYSNQWSDLLKLPVDLETGLVRPIAPTPTGSVGFPAWVINPDDRAFTVPFAVIRAADPTDGSEGERGQWQDRLCGSFRVTPETPSASSAPGYWVRLLNIDRVCAATDDSLRNATDFEIEWARRRTYKRWAHDGSLFGFCEHSFATMVPAAECDEAGKYFHGEPPLALHVGRMYFDVTLLLLYLRVAVLRFGRELHDITRAAIRAQGVEAEFQKWRKQFHELRRQFVLLENLYRFPHFSNQQQHLEMYAMQREFIDVEELYAEVDKEVSASDDFLQGELDVQRNALALQLNAVATFGLAVALALGWMGADSGWGMGPLHLLALVLFSSVVLVVPFLLSEDAGRWVWKATQLRGRKRVGILMAAVLCLLAMMLGYPLIPGLENVFLKRP